MRTNPHTGTRPANLLIIDDEESICCLLHEILSERGYHAEIAMSGEDAIDKIRRIPFDVILSDICLPGLSGIDILKMVRRDRLPAQVILISAFATLEMSIEALREGAVDLIPKPIPDLEAVVRAVERALERRPGATPSPTAEGREEQRLRDEMLSSHASLASRLTSAAPAGWFAECAAAVGAALGARRVEIELALPGERLPARVAWPGAATPVRPAEDRRETLTQPIASSGRTLGTVRVIGGPTAATRAQIHFLESVAALAGVVIDRAELQEEREASFVRLLEYLVHVRETMAGFEEGHSRRVADLATRLGRSLGFTERGLELLRRAAVFHDLGKLGVDPELLSRRGPLSPSELAAVRRHTEVAERLLGATACLDEVRQIVAHLTDRTDGNANGAAAGGATSGDAPLESRILAAAEAYVSMTSARPHRPALERSKAIAEMRREAGSRFDPEVVQALEGVLETDKDGKPLAACGIAPPAL
jgi:response regulator RpfG family c-di-GMP phosphodiesterase